MISNEYTSERIRNRIAELEREHNVKLTATQKLLLSIVGQIVSPLDVLYGNVRLFILEQKIIKADKEVAEKLDLNEGDEVDFREVLLHKRGRPLVYAWSYIPKERCSDEVFETLLDEIKTTGKILVDREIETVRKINDISIEKTTPLISNLFKTEEKLLTREYALIHKKNIVIWTKEAYPISYFRDIE